MITTLGRKLFFCEMPTEGDWASSVFGRWFHDQRYNGCEDGQLVEVYRASEVMLLACALGSGCCWMARTVGSVKCNGMSGLVEAFNSPVLVSVRRQGSVSNKQVEHEVNKLEVLCSQLNIEYQEVL